MKKLLSLFLTLIMIFSLAACGIPAIMPGMKGYGRSWIS